ncbi:MAG: phage tail protein I [Rhizobiales bacterium]|nr:phage tail protein I [Hyphomicrobiales bacterium]
MTEPRAPAALVPPSVADIRGRAFGEAMQRALNEADFRRLLMERPDEVDARLLPFLVREFSIEEFVQPDMREDVVRGLLAASHELHAAKGFLRGVRRGLSLLGMSPRWTQWFERAPKGAPGTHEVTIYVNRFLFDRQGAWLDARVLDAALRMIDGTKRWSQHVAVKLGASFAGAVGAADATRAAGLARLDGRARTPGFASSAALACVARPIGRLARTGDPTLPGFGGALALSGAAGAAAILKLHGEVIA